MIKLNGSSATQHDIRYWNITKTHLLCVPYIYVATGYVAMTMMTVTVWCMPNHLVHISPPPSHCAAVDDASLEGEESATDWSESSETDHSNYSSESDLEH